MKPHLKIVSFDKLDLGKEYLLYFGFVKDKKSKVRRVKFIKTTAKGYNFLDIATNKCILKRHLYLWKDSGSMVMHRSIRLSPLEIETELDKDKFINLESII